MTVKGDQDRPRITDRETLYSGFVELNRVGIEFDWGGKRRHIEREIHDHGNVAAIVPVDPKRQRVLLIRQFRAGPFLDGEDGWLWEIPAGIIHEEAPEECAVREAKEETGAALRTVSPLGAIWPSPGLVKEKVHLFWGVYEGPPPSATGGMEDESEFIEVHELPVVEVISRLDAGEIGDGKSALALYLLRAQRPDLFRTV